MCNARAVSESTQLVVRLPESLRNQIEALAERDDLSMAQVVRKALRYYMAREATK